MSETPADIMAKALEVAEHCSIMSLISQRADIVARALIEERERCAKVAEETGKAYCRDHFVMMGPSGIAHKVAHAIRDAALTTPGE